jgi:adenosylcobinamide kinase / adenosylcobinamide-phosphate guanylyltransferase
VKITLLGTGNAAGWPHPFCTCASCAAAFAEGEIRAHTSALIDDVLLIDIGHDVPRSAARLGVGLDRVRTVLVTHHHEDHAFGAALLWRAWAGRTDPLTVIGPRAALAVLTPWLPPDQVGVDFEPIEAGETREFGAYTVRALAADHESAGAVLYDITDSTKRLLYATDTGPRFAATPGARYDLLLLENSWGDRPPAGDHGHHGLDSFATTVSRLRRDGSLDDKSRVVAIHVGHGNPAPSVLRSRLAAMGAELPLDGAVLRLGGAQPDRVVPRRTLVLGGARSGKSVTAERLLAAEPSVQYVATATRPADDTEWDARVALHQARRPVGWTTIETLDLVALLDAHTEDAPPLLIDCLTVWLAGAMDAADVWTANDKAAVVANQVLADTIDALVIAWRNTRGRVVAVSNEVGSGIVPEYASGRRFRDELGSLNARIAADSDEVLVVEAGIVRSLKRNPHPPEQP